MNKGAAGTGFTATTEAGFEGTSYYLASGSCTYGLASLKADQRVVGGGASYPGLSWVAGDIDGVSYQPLSANVSIFKAGV